MNETLQIVVQLGLALIGAAGLVSASVITYKSARKRDGEANAITFSKNLMDRLESLEDDVSGLRTGLDRMTRDFKTSLNYIESCLLWERRGSKPPKPPIPESIKGHLDPSLITEHIKQEEHSRPKA